MKLSGEENQVGKKGREVEGEEGKRKGKKGKGKRIGRKGEGKGEYYHSKNS